VPSEASERSLRLDAALRRRVERLGLEFSIEFHSIARRHRPDDLEVLAELGHAYTRLGRIDEGLAVDRRLVALAPDNPTVHYNLACSLALAGEFDAALASLEESVRLGYGDVTHLLDDEDLISLREMPRFQSLVASLKDAGPH
jgi:tetratricopeptide (TPR) repeat protein